MFIKSTIVINFVFSVKWKDLSLWVTEKGRSSYTKVVASGW